MRGHAELVRARHTNQPIRIVAISMVDLPRKTPGVGVNDGGQAYLEVGPDDAIDRLDLRCVAGLRVVVVAHEDKRGLDLIDRLAVFGPAHIGFAGDGYNAQWTAQNGLQEWE